MDNENKTLEIPYGTRDYLPDEAAEKRMIETTLASLFARWGYDEVVTPTIEFIDTLTMDSGRDLAPQLFKLFDKKGRTLALRHEMTTPIARVVASRMMNKSLPLKLSYISSVFRSEQSQVGRQCEFYQAGVELIGSVNAAADAEVIALAIQSLLHSGLQSFTLYLGQVDFVMGMMHQYHLSSEIQFKLKQALENHNLVAYHSTIEELDLAAPSKKNLETIPDLNGGREMLDQAYNLALSEQGRRAIDNLVDIYHFLEAYGVEKYVRFDLGLIRDFSYYTGMVFEVYTDGLGYPLAGGGRYDRMLSDFGFANPATGFAVGIERILLALQKQGSGQFSQHRDFYVAYARGKETEAINRTLHLRNEGKTVELALHAQTNEQAECSRKENGYDKLVYFS
jgi:ATP phosphoribosyltransferase regulatory subunit